MSSRLRPCCVPGCSDKNSKRHRFTTKRQCREIWLQRIGNEKLLELDDQSLQSHRICDRHFEDICKEANGRIKNLSLPTLHLPGYGKKENDVFFLPSPEGKKNLTFEIIKERMHVLESSTFRTTESSPVGSVNVPKKVYTRKKLFSEVPKDSDIDFGSKKPSYVEKLIHEEPSTSHYQPVSSITQPEVNAPPLDLPQPNIVHVTNLINSSNSFASSKEPCIGENSGTFTENETNTFNQINNVKKSVGEHRCRTCLNTTDAATRKRLTENLLSGKTIKDLIVLLVPEMGSKLRDDDVVCGGCLQILESTSKFVQNCLEVEALLANQKINFAADVQELPVDNLNQYENIRIKEEIVDSTDGEHDYCSRFVSVGIDEPTDNPTNINNLLDWGVDVGNEANNVKAEYVHVLPYGHTIKVECDDPLCDTDAAQVSLQNDNEEKVGEVGGKTKTGKLLNKKAKQTSKKVIEKCSKCGRDIHAGFMKHHLEKHRREERLKLERKKRRKEARERANRTCGTCNESFGTKEEFEFHLALHPPLICDLCGKGFMKNESLRAHKNTHNAPNSFICEICGKGYKEVCGLRVHRRVHDKKRFKCPVCQKMFSHEGECNRHRKRVHQKKKRDSQCTMCGKMFATAAVLKGHIKLIHFREKPYECDVCHKKFGRADYLSNHKSRHKGEHVARRTKKIEYKVEDNGEPVTCKFCGKLYKSVVALKRHLETHLKRYACQFCPLTFCTKALSQRHEKIHEDGTVNFFRCNVCWKRFKTKEALEEHSASHKNAQYSCDLCDKTFNRRFLMNHHKLMNHMEKPNEDEVEKIIFDSLVEANAIQSKD